MRLRAAVFAAVAFAGAGLAAFQLAQAGSGLYERSTATQASAALAAAGLDWATVTVDGLNLTLAGAAPDEASRFRATEIVRRIALGNDVADSTTIRAAVPLPPPSFALELLRNEQEVSLIGLVPETGGRDVIRSALGAGGFSEPGTDMLESAAEPAPEGWPEALGFGLALLAELPRTKISVAPGSVKVIAIADSEADSAALEARLLKAAPDGVALALEISAPRPVISPFTFELALAGGRGRLEACSADTPEAAAAILAAARAAGLDEGGDCAIGLGAPSPDWAQVVTTGIAALGELGGGRLVLHDTVVELTPPPEIAPERLQEVVAGLMLPEGFEMRAAPPPVPRTETIAAPAPEPRFQVERLIDGSVRLAGPVRNATSQQAILSYAAALFGHDRVTDATVVEPALPEGWPGRVLAGIEALAAVDAGMLTVTSGQVVIDGWSIEPDAGARVSALLSEKVGKEAQVRVGYNAVAAEAARQAVRPRPELCADQIGAILDASSIQFDAGSADILPESRGVIAAIADVLRACPGAEFEIGGHTDAEGTAEANRALSEARAQAVLAALRAEDLPMVSLTARGFGPDQPVADNATDGGRARNRRIEFTLVVPEEPVPADTDAALSNDPAAEAAGAWDGCVAEVAGILVESGIEFAAGSSTIAPESAATIGSIAEVLRTCPDARIEIGGHTDSRGSESGNQRLSQERAEAVLAALRAEGLALAGATARGYGEAEPVGDNATAEGRAANRRIAFTPLPGPGPSTAADPDVAAADAACGSRIAEILAGGSIEFAAGAAAISPESQPVIEAIAGVLTSCPDVAMEIGGHTDSQGSETGNERLSQERAEAVLAALRAEDLPLPGVTAHGYGETVPVADNATADGRARNRRIAFSLLTAQGDALEPEAEEVADGPQ